MTTKTDQDGNWVYIIQEQLKDYHHRVYATINSMTGKVVKQSPPTSFLVKEAKAVTADDYFDTEIIVETTTNMSFYYIIGAGLLVPLAVRGLSPPEGINLSPTFVQPSKVFGS